MKKPTKVLLILILSVLTLSGFSQKKHINFEFLQTKGLSQKSVYCMLKDRKGFMWFGTQAGLNKFDGYKFTVYTHTTNDSQSIAANHIVGLCEDNGGTLWAATLLAGVSQYVPASETFINYQEKQGDATSLSNNQTNLIYNDRRGNIWVGTISGLNLFNKKTKKFTRYLVKSKNDSQILVNISLWGKLYFFKQLIFNFIKSQGCTMQYAPENKVPASPMPETSQQHS